MTVPAVPSQTLLPVRRTTACIRVEVFIDIAGNLITCGLDWLTVFPYGAVLAALWHPALAACRHLAKKRKRKDSEIYVSKMADVVTFLQTLLILRCIRQNWLTPRFHLDLLMFVPCGAVLAPPAASNT